jgi:hypothetical protein
VWFIAPVLALLAALGMVAARSRRHPKPKPGGAPAASTREPGGGGP